MKIQEPEFGPGELEAMLTTMITILVGIGCVMAIAHFKGPAAATGFLAGCFFMVTMGGVWVLMMTRRR